MQAIPSAVLIGAQRWRAASIVGLITGGMAVPAVIAVLAAGGGIVGIFAVEAAISVVNLAWTSVLARRHLRTLPVGVEHDRVLRRRTLAYAGWGTLGALLTFVVFRRSEFFFLERFSSDAEIAMYSIAFAAMYAVTLIPEALAAVVVPAFATLFGAGHHERMQSALARALRLVVLISIPLAAAVLALGPDALLLVYGEEYARIEPVLRVMVIGLPLLSLLNICNAFLVGLGKARPMLIIGGVAAIVNVALAVVLIPAWDSVGAALANLLAQVTVAVITFAYVVRTVPELRLDLRSFGSTLLASAGGALPAWIAATSLGGIAGVLVGLLLGSIAFAILAMLVKLMSAEDASWLQGATVGGALEKPVMLLCRTTARHADSGAT
jgi:O-antigen/teichoic acid export membrane protein